MTKCVRTKPIVRSRNRRGIVLIVILGLLAVLALLGVSFALLAGSEERAAAHFHNAARRARPELDPKEIILEALGQLVADTDNPRSAVRGHSLLRDMYGNDNDLYDERGRPYPNGKVEPFERYQRAYNGPGEKGPDGILNTPDDKDINYVFNHRIPERDPVNPARGGGFDEDYDYPDHQNMFLAYRDGNLIIPSFHRPQLLVPPHGMTDPGDWAYTADTPGRGRRVILRPRPVEHPDFPTRFNGGTLVPDVDNDGDGVADSVWLDIGLPVMRAADGRKFKPLVAYMVLDLDGRLNLNVHGQLNADKLDAQGQWVFPNAGDNVPDSHADHATPAHTGIPTPPLIGLGSGLSVTEVNLQNVFRPQFFPNVYAPNAYSAAEYRWLLEGRLANGTAVPGRWGEPWLLLQGVTPRAGFTRVPGGATPADDDLGVALELGLGDRILGGLWRPYRNLNGNLVNTRVTTDWYLARWPMDMDGDGAFWVTTRGQIRFGPSGNPGTSWPVASWGAGGPAVGWPSNWGEQAGPENVNEADEMNVYDVEGGYHVREDQKFTLEDLETLLRWGDVDQHLLTTALLGPDGAPGVAGVDDDADGTVDNLSELGSPGSDDAALSRLGQLAPSLFDSRDVATATVAARRRRMLTTESWDLITFNLFPLVALTAGTDSGEVYPVPGPNAPPAAHRLVGNGRLWTPPPTAAGGWGTGPTPVLAPGLMWTPGADGAPGQAGVDDNSDGVVDDLNELGWPNTDDAALPVEIALGRRLNLHRQLIMPPAPRNGMPYWAQVPVISPNDPRALARDIYLLLRLIKPTSNLVEIRRMAQFAVNVVDFIDPDDVMTAFEYDTDLTNGWNVDGNIDPASPDTGRPDRAVVWGVEKPQVVINETLAFETENDGYQLWFELYNPGLPTAEDANGVVDLARYPANGGIPRPVYEVVLGSAETNDATDPVTGEPNQARVISRFVFEPPPAGATATTTRIEGGQFLLVGPATVNPAPVTIPQVDFDTGSGAFGLGPGDANDTSPPRRRLYLRRLAHPGHPPHPVLNPYITVDCLEVRVWSRDAVVPDPADPNARKRFRSVERLEAYAVKHQEHSQNGNDDNPHTLKAVNENDRQVHTPLFFHDRPFSTPFELMLVPGCPAPWLTTLFTLLAEADQVAPLNFYTPGAQETAAPNPLVTGDWQALDTARPFLQFAPGGYFFAYLWNFFREETGQMVPTPGYYRLFELVEVPSRMNGSRDVYQGPGRDNRRWRVPGKVNLNTVTEPEVFLALFNNHLWPYSADAAGTPLTDPAQSLLWQAFIRSRYGPDGRPGTADDMPFRSFRFGISGAQTGAWNPLLFSMQATLLRGDPPAGNRMPLFVDQRQTAPPGLQLGQRPNLQSYPGYFFQPLTKLGNVFTTRSHVFAVWITVGFFEVTEENYPAVGLDGVDNDGDGQTDEPDEIVYIDRLGPEIGSDTGQVVRHRAFFIVDRSRADGWPGPPQSREELLDLLRKVVVLSRVIE